MLLAVVFESLLNYSVLFPPVFLHPTPNPLQIQAEYGVAPPPPPTPAGAVPRRRGAGVRR